MTEIKNIGFDISPKKVKWVPVLLENQSHFKKIVNNLFDILNIIKIRNSEISNNLYKLVSKIKKIEEDNNANNREVEEIFESIEDIDYILDRLNIDIDDLKKTLKKKFLGGNVILMLR